MLIVARLISPDELGVYSLAFAVWLIVLYTAAFGIDTVISRRDLDADKLAPTAITITLCCGSVAGLIMAIFAAQIASALGSVEAASPIRILSIGVVVAGFFSIPNALNRREFNQKKLFGANLAGFILGSAALLILANLIPGAEAFAWSRLVTQVVSGAFMVSALKQRYWPGWNGVYFVPLIRLALPAAVAGAIAMAVLNVDYVILGRRVSATELGLYVLAYNISTQASAVLGLAMKEVILPGFSGIHHNTGDLRSAVFRATRLISLVACPMSAFTCGFAYPLIQVVYGAKWVAAAPTLEVLAPYGAFLVLVSMCDLILTASGKTTTTLLLQITRLVVLVPSLIMGVRIADLVGAGFAHLITTFIVIIPLYALAVKAVSGGGLTVMMRGFSRPAIASIMAVGVARGATYPIVHPAATVAVALLVGLVVYVAVVGGSLLDLAPRRLAGNKAVQLLCEWPTRVRKLMLRGG